MESERDPSWQRNAGDRTGGDVVELDVVEGAFEGAAADEAYFVRCDHTTTTQSDIDRGIVNVVVGFAPLKPAEFVIFRVFQKTQEAKS